MPHLRNPSQFLVLCKNTILWIFFSFIFISWRLITLQYCSGFCHTLTWISHGFTCVPHPDPHSRLPPPPIPRGLPRAPALNTCLMHPTWTGDLFHTWSYTCFDAILEYLWGVLTICEADVLCLWQLLTSTSGQLCWKCCFLFIYWSLRDDRMPLT